MDFHGIDMQGIFYIEYQSTLPPFDNARDYRRFIYVPEAGTPYLYYGGTDRWYKLAIFTDIVPVHSGGTGNSFFPNNSLIVGNNADPFKFIEPGNEGDLLTTIGNQWVAAPPPVSVTCSEKGDIQSHNGIEPDTFIFNGPHNGKMIISDWSEVCGMRWGDIFDDLNISKIGNSSFSGLSSETSIPNPFDPVIPRFFMVIPIASDPFDPQIGFVGEIWTRKTATALYVGNTGSSTMSFSWFAIR